MRIAVLGAGAWGTALAIALAPRRQVILAGRTAAFGEALRSHGRNQRYLPEVAFPAGLAIADSFSHALADSLSQPAPALILIGTPVSGLRASLCLVAERSQGATHPVRVIWLCKGFEVDSAALPHSIAQQELAGHPQLAYGVLTGPSFAVEVAQGLPAALTIASADEGLRTHVTQALHGGALRIYGSDDVVGAEVGGAVKNVVAIATGICDGLRLGTNARAALITRGLAEMTRLGVALGGRADTFSGLTGMGDLILTATGDLSRNRTVGLRLARGESLADIVQSLGHVAEGVRCARTVAGLAATQGISMPIVDAVCAVLFDGMQPAQAVEALLKRNPKEEVA